MFRVSIKTKLSAVIAILVVGFALFNVAYYPRQVERRFLAGCRYGDEPLGPHRVRVK